jgi:NADH:ubiquinone oxidoreductase subunit 3 (subunit A)
LLFPWRLYLYSYNFFIFIVFFLFLFILALGILFEWKLNILEWPYIYKKSKLE